MPASGEGLAASQGIVSATNVKKTYRTGTITVPALRGVSLNIARGEMVAVMGPSGCGKTTLLNCLSGLEKIDDDAGQSIMIDGSEITTMPDRAKTLYRSRRMGFIFQQFNLLPVLTAAENVELPLLVSGVTPKEARKRAVDALAAVGLETQAPQRPGELSGGQQQRVTIARALVNNPAIDWADEPTGALDAENSLEIMELLEKLNRDQNLTLVIVTHAREVGERCERVLTMRDGLITEDGRAAQGA